MQRIQRDNVALAYDESGSGAPPLLLIHGRTHDHSYLRPQFEYFGRRHRVVAVDLRGHGESDKPEQDYSIPGFADDLAWLVYELGLHRPIVVGHSMGGAIAVDLAGRYSELVRAGVLLEQRSSSRCLCARAWLRRQWHCVRPTFDRLLSSEVDSRPDG